MKNTTLKVAAIALGLAVAASAAQAANASRDVQSGGSMTGSGSSIKSVTEVGERAEVRYFNSVNSFRGTARWNQWGRGHAFVQIIENRNGSGYPLLLINTDGNGKIQNVGRVGTNSCGTTVRAGSSVNVTASISGRSLKITAGGCTFTGTAGTDNAYIKFGSYANGSAQGTQSVSWSSVSPGVSF